MSGEVSIGRLSSTISGNRANTDAVGTMDTPFTDDPPTLKDGELLRLAQ